MTLKHWSSEDLEYLETAWGNVSVPRIAKKLGRTEKAVTMKAFRMDLGGFKLSNDNVTLGCLLECFGHSNSRTYFKRQFINNGLKVQLKLVHKRRIYFVSVANFWAWAETHRNLLDFSKLEPLVLGAEPPWVAEQRKKDYYGKQHKKYRRWTRTEEDLLKYLVEKGCDLLSIVQRLNRSEMAVLHRCEDLGLTKPARRKAKPWDEAEKVKLLELWRDFYPPKIIGERLGRSASACVGMLVRIANPWRCVKDGRSNGDFPWVSPCTLRGEFIA